MYVPKLNEAPSIEAVEQFIKENGFATLIGQLDNGPIATHLPLMILDKPTGDKCLIGHISIANPQRDCFDGVQDMMAIFREQHTYISSSWYDHINVPTWNYIAVHVYGKVKPINHEELYSSLDHLTQKYEGDNPSAFNIKQMPDDMLHKEMKGIIGFEMDVSNVIGKYKLSQNRDDKNYFEIINKLEERGDEFSIQIAAEMKKLR